MAKWIIPCNLKYYDVEGAFKALPKIDWKQSSNVQVGDRIFIYVGAPVSGIRYQCKANKVDLPAADIDDSKFNLDGTNYVNYGRYMELEIIEEYDTDELTIKKLRENGLKGNIQGPCKMEPSLQKYIDQFVGKNSPSKINEKNGMKQKFIPEFKVGDVVTNKELYQEFQCGNMGGMRRSKITGTLVIISDHTKMYDDKWYGDEVHYTGMGKSGDQKLEGNQNKTLAESDHNGVEVHLFEVFDATKYTYQGVVKLAGKPYQEIQLGEDENARKVWMFPLKKVDQQTAVEEKIFEHYLEHQRRIAQTMSGIKLKAKAEEQSRKKRVAHRSVMSDTYIRDPYIARYAKERANGVCQLCEMPAPFVDENNMPYLESHHIVWLSQGGEDTIENTVALCPNCHRRMHILKRDMDVKVLQSRNKSKS